MPLSVSDGVLFVTQPIATRKRMGGIDTRTSRSHAKLDW